MLHNNGFKFNKVMAFILLLALFGSLVTITTANAINVVIDDFIDAPQLEYIIDDFGGYRTDTARGNSPIGGERHIRLGSDPLTGGINGIRISDITQNFLYLQNEGTRGYADIVWDGTDGNPSGIDPIGLSGINFIHDAGIEFDITTYISDGSTRFIFYMFSGENEGSAILDYFLEPGIQQYPFEKMITLFANPVDLSDVGAMLFYIEGAQGRALHIEINEIGTYSDGSSPVPEPSSFVLFGTAVMAVFVYARRQKRSKG